MEETSTASLRPSATARFSVGQLVHHRLFDYRGVVYDVDAVFSGSEDWYEQVARTRPPKDEPWYHVLPEGMQHTTYVAERNLESDPDDRPIEHELIDVYFESFTGGAYLPRREAN
jgi:heat shock protein HspQ